MVLLLSGSRGEGLGASSFCSSFSSPRREHMDEELEVEREEVVEEVGAVVMEGKDEATTVEEDEDEVEGEDVEVEEVAAEVEVVVVVEGRESRAVVLTGCWCCGCRLGWWWG